MDISEMDDAQLSHLSAAINSPPSAGPLSLHPVAMPALEHLAAVALTWLQIMVDAEAAHRAATRKGAR